MRRSARPTNAEGVRSPHAGQGRLLRYVVRVRSVRARRGRGGGVAGRRAGRAAGREPACGLSVSERRDLCDALGYARYGALGARCGAVGRSDIVAEPVRAGGPPPRIDLSGEGPDCSRASRVAGSLVPHPLVVSLRALGRYRHDAVVVRARSGGRVAYAGVALQFVPGIATLVRPAPAGSAALLGLGAATIVVRGRDGERAAFRSSELIDADGDPRVFLVDRRSGLPLVAPEGPFRVVSPDDSTHARWIEDVVEIDVER